MLDMLFIFWYFCTAYAQTSRDPFYWECEPTLIEQTTNLPTPTDNTEPIKIDQKTTSTWSIVHEENNQLFIRDHQGTMRKISLEK